MRPLNSCEARLQLQLTLLGLLWLSGYTALFAAPMPIPIQVFKRPAVCCEPTGCSVTTDTQCTGVFLASVRNCGLLDCNSNGVSDKCDIANELSLDVNSDGIPDECQVSCTPPCDAWITVPNAQSGVVTHHNFSAQPIPADFFFAGSEAFGDTVNFVGVPIDPAQFGQADTLVDRDQDPIALSGSIGTNGFTNMRIRALRMESTQPIQVVAGMLLTFWDVEVGLSKIPQVDTQMWATKTHANGGTYDSTLQVGLRFVFRRVGNPSDFRVLDAAEQGYYPLYLVANGTPWVHTLDPTLDVFDNLGLEFFAGVLETTGRASGIPMQVTVEVEEPDSEDDVEHTVECPPDCCDPEPTGACCHDDGTCEEGTTEEDCDGTYQGDDTDCSPLGSCCLPDGSCIETTEECCEEAEGTFDSLGSCYDLSACCLPDDTCVDTTFDCCEEREGFWSEGVACGSTGACCLPDGTCVDTSELCCSGDYQGDGTSCPAGCQPCSVSIDQCPIDICVGETYGFHATGQWNGTASFTYIWTVTGPGASNVTPQSQSGSSSTFNVTGVNKSSAQNDVTVTVELIISGQSCGTDSCSFTVAGVDIDQCPTTLEIGDSADIHADSFWGHTASPFYNWTVISGADKITPTSQYGQSPTFNVTGVKAGSVTVQVEFIKSGSVCDTATCTFTVEANCGVTLANCPLDVCVGQQKTFTANGTWQGTASPIYVWTVSGTGASKVSPQSASGPNTFTVTGLEPSDVVNDVTVTVEMYISNQLCGSDSCDFTVAGVQIDQCPTAPVNVGDQVTIHAAVISGGGTSVPNYIWSVIIGDDKVTPASQSGTSPTFVVTAQEAGQVKVKVEYIRSGTPCGEDFCSFVIVGDCEGAIIIDSTEWLVVHDPPFEKDHCQPSSNPRCKQAEIMGNEALVTVQFCDRDVDPADLEVWLVETSGFNDDIVKGERIDLGGGVLEFHFRTTEGSTNGGAKTDSQGSIYVHNALLPEGPSGFLTYYQFELRNMGSEIDSRSVTIKPLLDDLDYTPDILAATPEKMDPYSDMFDIDLSWDWGLPDGYGVGEGFGLLIEFDLNDDLALFPEYSFVNDPAANPWGGDNGVEGTYTLLLKDPEDKEAYTDGWNIEIKWEGFTDTAVVVDTSSESERALEVFLEGSESELDDPYDMGDGVMQSDRGVASRHVVKEGGYVNQFRLTRKMDITQDQNIDVPFEVEYEFE